VLRSELSRLLRFPEHHIHVIAPDVGGGFGLKAHVFAEEAVTAFLSWQLRLPVKWIEDRREHLLRFESGPPRKVRIGAYVANKPPSHGGGPRSTRGSSTRLTCAPTIFPVPG
jgi:aerobic carbon-monoxide dehydrogenase large subunit